MAARAIVLKIAVFVGFGHIFVDIDEQDAIFIIVWATVVFNLLQIHLESPVFETSNDILRDGTHLSKLFGKKVPLVIGELGVF